MFLEELVGCISTLGFDRYIGVNGEITDDGSMIAGARYNLRELNTEGNGFPGYTFFTWSNLWPCCHVYPNGNRY